MEKYFIKGGKALKGEVQISGAKNAASKMLIASLLTDEEVILHNIPLQQESDIAMELLRSVGAEIEMDGHTARIRTSEVSTAHSAKLTQSRKNRLSILMAAPLLHRVREAQVDKLVGDKIGPRPVNFHTDALQKMGAHLEATDQGWYFKVDGDLQGLYIELPYPSVGATETIIFAGVLAKGKTVIRNCAIEPEIHELIMMLQKMGAIIEMGVGREITIYGVEKLSGCEHTVLPDRLEVASYACIALATAGDIFCRGARHADMITFLNTVRQIGGGYEVKEDGIRFFGSGTYKPVNITTDTFPGFSTDWQQPLAVVLTQAEGQSIIHETVYEDRFKYTETLNEMGANIKVSYMPEEIRGQFQLQHYRQSAVIQGKTDLKATRMSVPDIRAGLAYVAAALVADGESELDDIHHLERGYENLEEKLKAIGAEIRSE